MRRVSCLGVQLSIHFHRKIGTGAQRWLRRFWERYGAHHTLIPILKKFCRISLRARPRARPHGGVQNVLKNERLEILA